ncbi:polysaccharide lyase [Dyadobacter sp. CY326]|uniref:polysaccharide lyase n=1 Tax=Dyadobacter sp. CY326 TaxID=2907300 RepID=UPI001F2A1D75|nr:polysaccharide lyase [Dyadobacter sp. CY326]MCE7066601.1 polysaccharide lyase [Dyadobacter sp. CY326]
MIPQHWLHVRSLLSIVLFCGLMFGCKNLDVLEIAEQDLAASQNTASPARSALGIGEDSSLLVSYHFDQEIGNWYENSTCCPWSITLNKSIKRAGTSSMKVELQRQDTPNDHRAELGQAPNMNKEGWYGFSVYFPSSFVKESIEESIVQWNSLPDLKEGESWRSAPLFLGVLNDRFVLEIRSDAKRITNHDFSFTRLDLGPVDKETWHDWVFHIKWAYDNTGIIEVWKDKKQVLSRLNQPNSYNDAMFPYFKIGIYKWDWSTKSTEGINSRTMYVDEIAIGNQNADLNKVSPLLASGPLPVTIASFAVAKQGTAAKLKWSTSQEVNADRFYIQRSTNAKDWKSIGEKSATGASQSLTNYAFSDAKPAKGNSYYRLKMVDKDQTFAYSSIKSIKF